MVLVYMTADVLDGDETIIKNYGTRGMHVEEYNFVMLQFNKSTSISAQ